MGFVAYNGCDVGHDVVVVFDYEDNRLVVIIRHIVFQIAIVGFVADELWVRDGAVCQCWPFAFSLLEWETECDDTSCFFRTTDFYISAHRLHKLLHQGEPYA